MWYDGSNFMVFYFDLREHQKEQQFDLASKIFTGISPRISPGTFSGTPPEITPKTPPEFRPKILHAISPNIPSKILPGAPIRSHPGKSLIDSCEDVSSRFTSVISPNCGSAVSYVEIKNIVG